MGGAGHEAQERLDGGACVVREFQSAGVLELAAAKLRSGKGWDEGIAADLLGESCVSTRRT